MSASGSPANSSRSMWIPIEVLDWPASTESMGGRNTDWESHYKPWEHANESLSGRASLQDRASAILQLRRAIDLRDKALKAVYALDRIPCLAKSAYPKILTDLGIVMPLMRKKLIDLRNEVAHEKVNPDVDLDRCLEYCEFTWYFLKSTDHLLSAPIQEIGFDGPDDLGGFSLTFDFDVWSILAKGVFSPDFLLSQNRGNDIELRSDNMSQMGDKTYIRAYPEAPSPLGCALAFNKAALVKLLKVYFATRY